MTRTDAGEPIPAHPVVLALLAERATASGTAVALHGRCADALSDAAGWEEAELRARHLAAAGRWDEAWAPLARATTIALEHSDNLRVRELIALVTDALAALGVPESDPRHGERMRLEALAARNTWDRHGLAATTAEYLRASRAWGWDAHLPWALWLAATGHRAVAEWTEARACLDEAEALPGIGPEIRGRLLSAGSTIAGDARDFPASMSMLTQARALYEEIGDAQGAALMRMLVLHHRTATSPLEEADLAEANALYAEFERLGDREGMGRVDGIRYMLLHAMGRAAEADEAGRRGMRHYLVIGSPRAFDLRMQIAARLIKTSRAAEAEAEARRVVAAMQRGSRPQVLQNARTVILVARATAGDAAGVAEQLDALALEPWSVKRPISLLRTRLAAGVEVLEAAGEHEVADRLRRAITDGVG